MRIIFVEGKNFGKRFADKANLPYVSVDSFIAAVGDAKMPEALAAKLLSAMLKQMSADDVVFGIEVGEHVESVKAIVSGLDNIAYVQMTDAVDAHFQLPGIAVFDAVDILSGALSLTDTSTPVDGGALENA